MKELIITKNILNENSDVLKCFFKDIDKYPIYSGEEQIELAKLAKNGDKKARDKLINSNLRFVISCAKKYTKQGVPLVDLIQSGLMGLCMALENYDPNKGYKFLSFAVWYIRREIYKEIYNNGRTIRYPITYINKITKVKKIHDSFVTEKQREPTQEELIKLTNLTKKQYESVIKNKSYCQSIDSPITTDEKTTLKDIIPEEVDPFNDVFIKESILKAINVLDKREQKVITEFYGINTENKSIKEIASEMNLSDERIRQLRKQGIKKLKSRCGKTLKTLL